LVQEICLEVPNGYSGKQYSKKWMFGELALGKVDFSEMGLWENGCA